MFPLSGLKVVELATVVAAPTAAEVLCAYGADVIKIEPLRGDDMRRAGASEGVPYEDDFNPLFTVHNSNKRLTAIDLKKAAGKDALLRMLDGADVFLTNVRTGSLARLGLSYDELMERFPRIIYAHFAGYGPKGPDAEKPGFDSTAFWLRNGPIMDWQVPGSFPMYPSYAFGDMATSSAFVSAILMAIIGREKTGKGTLVRTSLMASGIWCNAVSVVSTQPRFGKEQQPDPIRPPDPFSAVYKCADGQWIGFYCNDYALELEKFSRLFSIEDILSDPRCASVEALHETDAIAELTQRMNAIMLTRSAEEWSEIFTANNISHQIARRARNVSSDPQALANGYVVAAEFPGYGKVMLPCPPMEFSEYVRKDYRPTGAVGADTDVIFAELGFKQEEIDRLRQSGIIK